MILTDDQYEQAAALLDASGEYRVLRRIRKRPIADRAPDPPERIALIVDTETTGLDLETDEVIEIGILCFLYNLDTGAFGDIVAEYDSLREPSIEIPQQITEITGITPELVRGKTIDLSAVDHLVQSAALIIAHNASFDRPMCERLHPAFADKAWACSATEVDWHAYGFEGAKLSYLLNQAGLFHNGHRALDDCISLLEVLLRPLRGTDQTAFQQLLTSARKPRVRVETPSPYHLAPKLRSRGYRWADKPAEGRRYWWIELEEVDAQAEIMFLSSLPGIPPQGIRVKKVTAFQRYKKTPTLPNYAIKDVQADR